MPLFEIALKKANSRKHRTTPEEQAIDKINREILENGDYDDIEDLDQQLERYKAKFLAFQKDAEGNIDLVGLKKMLEECGQPKTHLELKKMIRQVDKTNTGTICYRDFVTMMCGPANSVLKIILRFEQREADKDKLPVGPPPKRDLASLP